MFRKTVLVLIFFLLLSGLSGQSFRVLTCNIRYDNPSDGSNSWSQRKTWLSSQIRQAGPGIFGIQEGLAHQVAFLDSALAGYRHIGVGRDDGKNKGEFSAIFYDTLKFRVLEQSTFWLSPTPGTPSIGWDAACIRICTCGLFQDIRTGKKFRVFNTHLDHMGTAARKNSAILILKKMKELNRRDLPVILMGDFNGGPDSEPLRCLEKNLTDTYVAAGVNDTAGTFNGFGSSDAEKERIDFIFTGKKGFAVKGYRVIREFHDGLYPSDHFPVTADLQFEEQKKP